MFGDDGSDVCKRREERRVVDLGAMLHRRDGSCRPAAVRDLSYEGCRLSGGEALEPAERLRLVIPALGELEAQVRWSGGNSAGLKFGEGLCNLPGDLSPRSALTHARHVNFGSRRMFGRKGVAG
jgi:hypothetical protein